MTSVIRNTSWRAMYVWRRNVDVYLTTWKTNFLPPLLEPLQYLVAFGLGLGGTVGVLKFRGLPVPYMNYLAPGTISIAIMFWSYFETTYGSYVRMYYQRTFDAITATPLLVEDVIAGELAWGATKSVIASCAMLPLLSAFGLVHYPSGLLVVPLAAIGGLLFAAIGMLATSLVPTIEGFNLPMFLLITPQFVLCGTFFPVDNLPSWARAVALCLPLTHVSRLVRAAVLGRVQAGDLAQAAALFAAAMLLAHLAVSGMRRRLVK